LVKYEEEIIRLRKRVTPNSGASRTLHQINEAHEIVSEEEKKLCEEKKELLGEVERLQLGCSKLQETVGYQEVQINQLQLEVHRLEKKSTILAGIFIIFKNLKII
jgi:hypothetical protein